MLGSVGSCVHEKGVKEGGEGVLLEWVRGWVLRLPRWSRESEGQGEL